ncbi:MAG: hypothetical protein RBR81_14100 [Bacteroidales bacterium]|jgi:hypothetical protein|nr:hypothetical protein [Bacteroidales bacterium]
MKIFKILTFLVLFSLVSGCSKDDSDEDYASDITGLYTGTVTYTGTGTVPASCELTKSSNTKVDLVITIQTNTIPFDGINISSSSGGRYSLSYSDPSGSLTGTVDGNKLDWTLTAGSYEIIFTGTK